MTVQGDGAGDNPAALPAFFCFFKLAESGCYDEAA